jgi:hypothetical protein
MAQPSHSDLQGCLTDYFLKRNPVISSQLLLDLDQNLDQLRTLLEPALNARNRCQVADFYIQAVTTGRNAFLMTNLMPTQPDLITDIASNWLIGRHSTCDIVLRSISMSRFHASIGFTPSEGFYLTDLNSTNGTWVNRRRLEPLQRVWLQDGDLLRFSSYRAEFFWTAQGTAPQRPIAPELATQPMQKRSSHT